MAALRPSSGRAFSTLPGNCDAASATQYGCVSPDGTTIAVVQGKISLGVKGENVVAFSATPTFISTAAVNTITLTGPVTSSTLAAGIAGQGISLIICQDATGSRTFTFPSNVKGGGVVASTASTCSSQHFVYSSSLGNYYADAAMVMGE